MNMRWPSPASDGAGAGVLSLRVISSIVVHAAAAFAVWGGGQIAQRAKTAHPHHDIAPAMMVAWIVPAAPAAQAPQAPQPPQPRRVVPKPKPQRAAETIAHTTVDRHEPAEPPAPTPEPPAPAAPALDAAAFVPQPPAIQAPSEQNVSLLFVGIEDGEWLQWLTERHGFVAFTSRRDTVIEHVYSVNGELLPLSAVPLADTWSLEVDQPERVAALADMLARERQRGGDAATRIRVFALFPASFRDEVAAAVHRAGVKGGSVFVSFSAGELKVAGASLSESKK